MVLGTDHVEKSDKTPLVDESDIPNFDFPISHRLWMPERQAVPSGGELDGER